MGDPKVIWELNRHQWLVTLGQAYRMTGDEQHATIFASSVRAWMAANPVGWGINWSSSLEVAMRLISWCWALHLFRGSRALTPDLFAEMRAGIRSHATPSRALPVALHLTEHASHGEALGLFYAGTQFPCFRRVRTLDDRGRGGSWWSRSRARCSATALPESSRPATSGTRSRSTCSS
jgi:hypothetical protein